MDKTERWVIGGIIAFVVGILAITFVVMGKEANKCEAVGGQYVSEEIGYVGSSPIYETYCWRDGERISY